MKTQDRREEMLAVNQRQADYYESRFEAKQTAKPNTERAAGRLTNLWTAARRRMIRMGAEVGLQEQILEDHRRWLGDLAGRRVLDLGCFSGNALSLEIAAASGSYLGVDLSTQAIAELNRKLEGIPHARAEACDFLAGDLPAGGFDVIYAYGVMHHFRDFDVLLAEIDRVLAPGGILIGYDPMQTEPLNWVLRTLYRPFQSDRDWEFPFTRATFRAFQCRFGVKYIQGTQGLVRVGYPLGTRFAQRFAVLDRKHASRIGWWLWQCWNVTYCLIKH